MRVAPDACTNVHGRWRKKRRRARGNEPLKRNVKVGEQQDSDPQLETGGLVISDTEPANSTARSANKKGTLEQKTTSSDDSTVESDSGGYAVSAVVTVPRKLIKVIQINAVRSKYVTHQIDILLAKGNVDLCLIQEPATDSGWIYLLDRLPFRAITSGRQPKAAIIVVNPTISVLALRQLGTPHMAVASITVGPLRV